MDIFKFQDYLFDYLEPNFSAKEMDIAHDTVCQLLKHTNNPSHASLLLLHTAYSMMISARGCDGIDQLCFMLEQEAKKLRQSKTITEMRARTRAIETVNQD